MGKRGRSRAVMGCIIGLMAAGASAQSPTTAPSNAAPSEPAASSMKPPFNWITEPGLIQAQADAGHPINAIKDPSVVYYQGRWHVFASSVTKTGGYSMVYFNFADWKEANRAPQYHFSDNPLLGGYHCAPQVFYFAPRKLWYMIMVSQQPMVSTTTDITKPDSWSRPQNVFPQQPKSVTQGWLDYWMICDDTHAYLFFTDDHGRFYRSRTTLADFPKNFDEPVVALQNKVPRELFEGSCTYHIKGSHQYLTLIEAGNTQWKRYYKAFIADRLDGEWRPLAAEWGNSFADATRVRTPDGSPFWSRDISHGELLRDGYDQALTIDPDHLQLLYQGLDVNDPPAKDYNQLRWQLGLLRRTQ